MFPPFLYDMNDSNAPGMLTHPRSKEPRLARRNDGVGQVLSDANHLYLAAVDIPQKFQVGRTILMPMPVASEKRRESPEKQGF